jgi:hypothetical protein
MKYSIHIDQVHAIEWDLNLSEAACFSFCYTLPSWAETVIIDGEVYYFASRTKVIKELPILTDKSDTVYRLYKSIDEKGLIKYRRFSGKDCIQITAKGKEWNSEKNPSKETDSENFPNELGKKSETDSENFPTYNNTIKDNSTIDKINIQQSEHENENSKIPPAERKVKEALLRAFKYFEQYPAQQEYMCINAGRKDAMHPEIWKSTLEAWIRYNVDNPQIIQNIETGITKSFAAWLKRNLDANVKQKSNSYANRNTDNSERYTTGEKSPFNAGIGVVDPKYGF